VASVRCLSAVQGHRASTTTYRVLKIPQSLQSQLTTKDLGDLNPLFCNLALPRMILPDLFHISAAG
jgi:hypothetical protein